MDQLGIALILAAALSFLICTIEVRSQSKVAAFGNCFTGSFTVYVLIVIIGNTATTLVVATTLGYSPTASSGLVGSTAAPPSEQAPKQDGAKKQPGGESHGQTPRAPVIPVTLLERLPWFWYAFLGVFGFEV